MSHVSIFITQFLAGPPSSSLTRTNATNSKQFSGSTFPCCNLIFRVSWLHLMKKIMSAPDWKFSNGFSFAFNVTQVPQCGTYALDFPSPFRFHNLIWCHLPPHSRGSSQDGVISISELAQLFLTSRPTSMLFKLLECFFLFFTWLVPCRYLGMFQLKNISSADRSLLAILSW